MGRIKMPKKKKVKTKKNNKIKILVLSFFVVFLTAFLGSIFTSSTVNTEWYQETKPALTPPNYLFPIVWNILFTLIAISLYLVWMNSNKKEKRKIILVYGINFVLNILWSVLYFGLRNPVLAFFELVIFFFSIIAMIFVSYQIKKQAFYLLVPYALWVAFASILNYLSAFG
jgi:tryptophan-rich sensory protein